VTRSPLPLVLGLSLLLAACSSSESKIPAGDGGDSGAGGSSNTSGGKSGAAPAECPDGPGKHSDPSPVSIGSVTAQFVDELGQPTLVGRVQICGIDICRDVTAKVSESGRLATAIGESLDTPACKFGEGLDWAELLLPLEAGDLELGQLMTARLPSVAESDRFAPGKAISSGGVTLTLDELAVVQPNTLDYDTEELQQTFRAVALPKPALLQLKQDFVAGFGLAPLETQICPSPALRLQNDTGLTAGTELELYMAGLSAIEAWAPYATWQKIADGQVSDDGQSLEFPTGLPVLGTIGVKVKK
jgi:hypothetical protein